MLTVVLTDLSPNPAFDAESSLKIAINRTVDGGDEVQKACQDSIYLDASNVTDLIPLFNRRLYCVGEGLSFRAPTMSVT
jgi:hypothetical protein